MFSKEVAGIRQAVSGTAEVVNRRTKSPLLPSLVVRETFLYLVLDYASEFEANVKVIKES